MPEPAVGGTTLGDVTRDAGTRFVPRAAAKDGPGDGALGTGDSGADARGPGARGTNALGATGAPVVVADPLTVAGDYVTARLTYRFDDPAGYLEALTAPAFTTAAFAARSRPGAAALARVATAQERSKVQVATAELAGEAPNSDTVRYVVVRGTTTTAYRGGGSAAPVVWTVRLVLVEPGRWRVDGVLSTD